MKNDVTVEKNLKIAKILVMVVSILLSASSVMAIPRIQINSLVIHPENNSIIFITDSKLVYKSIKVDTNEALIAFNNALLSQRFKVSGDRGGFIKDINAEQFSGKVVSILIKFNKPVKRISSRWSSATDLSVSFNLDFKPKFKKVKKYNKPIEKPGGKKVAASGEKFKSDSDQIQVEDFNSDSEVVEEDLLPTAEGIEVATIEAKTKAGKKNKFDERFTGSTDDLFLELRSDACADYEEIDRALKMCNRKDWINAFDIFDNNANDNSIGKRCLENIYILRAYSFFKANEKGPEENLLEAVKYFEDFMSNFPKSIYMPYSVASLGKIYTRLGDKVQATGYFNVILKIYGDYPGTPEVLFELGRIYTNSGKPSEAVKMLEQVVREFSHGTFINEAKVALGKAYFEKNDFKNSLKVLTSVAKDNPRKIFESNELLLNIGNAYYHLGDSEMARETLSKVFNIFPDMENKDTVLTRIGDTFVEQGLNDKAVKIYQLVRERYPDSDGFVISSMRLADFVESKQEKEELYNVVIKDYPENPLARLALIRLAILQKNSGEYDKSILTIKALLKTKPRALRREAINLFQESSQFVFKGLLETDDYPELLAQFENDKRFLDDAENPELFMLVGMGYLKAHLYPKALDVLMKSYRRTGKKKRKPELLYSLGVAMQEVGKVDEAIGMLKTYTNKFPNDKNATDGFRRLGRLLYGKKQFDKGIADFKTAFLKAQTSREKAGILIEESLCYKQKGEHFAVIKSLRKAVNLLIEDSGKNYDLLYNCQKGLGESLMKVNKFAEAAVAFKLSLQFSDEKDSIIEVRFNLAEAYEKSKDYTNAEKEYKVVVENGDSFWSGMAQERLKAMKLNLQLEKS